MIAQSTHQNGVQRDQISLEAMTLMSLTAEIEGSRIATPEVLKVT